VPSTSLDLIYHALTLINNRWSVGIYHRDVFHSCQVSRSPTSRLSTYVMAWVLVHSRAVAIAAGSSSFHLFATSGARGSSGFGAPRSACIDRRMVRICSAGDQLPVLRLATWNTDKQMCFWDTGYRHTLKDVETDTTELVDVWMVYLGQKPDLWWGHGIIVREEEFELKNTTCVAVRHVVWKFETSYPHKETVMGHG
jgi:hypothetical protein